MKLKNKDMDKYVSMPQAAKEIGMTYNTVFSYFQKGLLKDTKKIRRGLRTITLVNIDEVKELVGFSE